MFPSVEENIELVAILAFSSGLLGNRSSERLWSFSNELILKNFSFCRKLKFFRGDRVFYVFVQVLVLTVGGGLEVLGWSRAVCGAGLSQWSSKILPAPSCVLFTMLVDVVDMLVDIVDMFGFVLRHECIVDQ